MPEQIESIEDDILASASHQLKELTPAVSAETGQLPIEDGILDRQGRYSCAKSGEAFADDLLPTDQFAPTVFDVRQRPETVVLQLEEPVGMVKRSRDSGRVDRLNAWQHLL